MDARNHRDMDAGNYTRMDTRDNSGVNERHRVNANYRLHPRDRHDAVDTPRIVRPRDVPVFDLAHVTIFRSRDVMIAGTSYVVVSVDIADPLDGSVPIDRAHFCACNRLLAVDSVDAPRLGGHWDRDDHRAHQSCDTS
jgi:hypothetical protein